MAADLSHTTRRSAGTVQNCVRWRESFAATRACALRGLQRRHNHLLTLLAIRCSVRRLPPTTGAKRRNERRDRLARCIPLHVKVGSVDAKRLVTLGNARAIHIASRRDRWTSRPPVASRSSPSTSAREYVATRIGPNAG